MDTSKTDLEDLGTPQEVTDAEGRIEWSADYSAWGERQHSLPLAPDEAAASGHGLRPALPGAVF
jgi:uncharacterized protein RhaS with RHS repeats